MTPFFRNLDKRRADLGITWGKWIKDLHVSYPTYLNWKRGANPHWSTVLRLAKLFDCEPTDLMKEYGKDNKEGECPASKTE